MKNMVLLTMVAMLTGCATMHKQQAPVTLEFRPGSQSPGAGLTEMTVEGSDQPVYISGDVVLSNADISSAKVASGPNGPLIEIVFTKAGAEKFATVTENNIRNPLGILVDGQLISAPIVMDRIVGGKAQIWGSFSPEEARRIADGIVGQ